MGSKRTVSQALVCIEVLEDEFAECPSYDSECTACQAMAAAAIIRGLVEEGHYIDDRLADLSAFVGTLPEDAR